MSHRCEEEEGRVGVLHWNLMVLSNNFVRRKQSSLSLSLSGKGSLPPLISSFGDLSWHTHSRGGSNLLDAKWIS